jgi:hypothetical protein
VGVGELDGRGDFDGDGLLDGFGELEDPVVLDGFGEPEDPVVPDGVPVDTVGPPDGAVIDAKATLSALRDVSA